MCGLVVVLRWIDIVCVCVDGLDADLEEGMTDCDFKHLRLLGVAHS